MDLKTGLQRIWDQLVAIFMAPGDAIMQSFAGTPWGAQWGIPADEWTINMGVALLFWCVVISILGAMNDQIRRMLGRNSGRRNRRKGDIR